MYLDGFACQRAARGKNGVDLAGRFFLALHADDRQHAAGNIDADQIALFHQRDRPADSGLGADVADDRAAACAGKTPVGDESYAGSERRVHCIVSHIMILMGD